MRLSYKPPSYESGLLVITGWFPVVLIVFTCVHYQVVRLEGSTTPQGMLVCFCGYSYPTLHCNISILRLSIVFSTNFQKLFCIYFTTHSTASGGLFLCPEILKIHTQNYQSCCWHNKKEYRHLLPIPL